MNSAVCNTCGTIWDATFRPYCPNCMLLHLLRTPDLVRPKHDPGSVSVPIKPFRSVMSGEYIAGSVDYLKQAVTGGTVFYSTRHDGYCIVTSPPYHHAAGSAIPGGGTVTAYPMDYLTVADVTGSPHVYAQTPAEVQKAIDDGLYKHLSLCAYSGCVRVTYFGENYCPIHRTPPLAT
jgi:hypothetical protein